MLSQGGFPGLQQPTAYAERILGNVSSKAGGVQAECVIKCCRDSRIWSTSIAADSYQTLNEKGDTNALDNLCNLTDPVVTGNGDFDHARRIHPSTADHRHCGGVAQSHSGQTTSLRLRLRNNMKAATDDINVFAIPGFRQQVNCFTHLLADVLFYVPSFYLIRLGAWELAPRDKLGRHGLLLHILAFHEYGISHAGAGHCRSSSVSPGPLSRMLTQSAEFPRRAASHLDAHGIAVAASEFSSKLGKT